MIEEHPSQNRADDGAARLGWFLAGMAIGATVALLYAPKSGRETRRMISNTTSRGCDAVSGTSRDIVDAGRDLFDRGRRLVEDAADLFDRGRRLVRG